MRWNVIGSALFCSLVLGLSGADAQQDQKSGFESIVERVSKRDDKTDAIELVSPMEGAPDSVIALVLSIKKIQKSKDVTVQLRNVAKRSMLVESYRFKWNERLANEFQKLYEPVDDSPVFLKIDHIRQSTDLCVPTCAAMALNYNGVAIKPRDIKLLANAVTTSPEFGGTYFKDLLNGLASKDIYWSSKSFQANDEGFKRGLDEIKKELRIGRPVIIDTIDHYTVLVNGFDEKRQLIAALDPTIAKPGLRKFSYVEFKKIWTIESTNSRAVIFTRNDKPGSKDY